MRGPHLWFWMALTLTTALAGCGKDAAPSPTAPAVTFTVSGVVRQLQGTQSVPVAFATVTLLTGGQSVREMSTGADGAFRFTDVPSAPLQVRATAAGFKSGTTNVSPEQPVANFLLEPELEIFTYTFPTGSRGRTSIPFTVGRRGEVTLRLTSNQTRCEVSYQFVYSAFVGQWGAYVCAPYPSSSPTVERIAVFDPGHYTLDVSLLGPLTPADKRELYLSYPR